jgi:hypothetical protein
MTSAQEIHSAPIALARFIASVFMAVLTTASLPPAGWGQAELYRGKTISMVVGSRLTGTLGISALAVSHHLGKHIPGNPTVILRQMPGIYGDTLPISQWLEADDGAGRCTPWQEVAVRICTNR